MLDWTRTTWAYGSDAKVCTFRNTTTIAIIIVTLIVIAKRVWFQNRRTKWRKKHAAEMATAKRKQEELGDGDGDCSEPMDSDTESLDLVDTGSSQRKRCRMEDDMRH
uniref:Uncharacterized protein n=1 Tax=Anopheles atroparvus TaxID=41427 RepID=A0A182JK95_ANOAO